MKKLYYIGICVLSALMGCSEYSTPESVAPAMSTGEVTGIYRFGATISGSFTEQQKSAGPVVKCGIMLSEYPSMAEADTIEALLVHSGEKYSVQVGNLKSKQEYYYRSFAGSGISIVKGEVKNFKTAAENVPVFSEGMGVSSDYKSATLSAMMIDEGGSELSMKGFCWKLATEGSTSPTVLDNVVNIDAQDFKGRISNLVPDRDYLICPYAINRSGAGYGNVVKIHTDATLVPAMSSIEVVNQTNSSIEIKSRVLSSGETAIFEKGFCWGTQSEPTVDGFFVAVDGMDEIVQMLTGMTPNITYYLRAYAKNSKGIGYGDTYTFKLKEHSKPMLSNIKVLGVSSNLVRLSSGLIADGGLSIQEIGFCYSDLNMPTIESAKVEIHNATVTTFEVLIDGLTPSTAYVIRAYAKNDAGVAYSQSICVETSSVTQPSGGINHWDDQPTEEGDLK